MTPFFGSKRWPAITAITNANNVTFAQTFDWLGRWLTRTALDSDNEKRFPQQMSGTRGSGSLPELERTRCARADRTLKG
jgi:hypothetical protein